MISASIVLSVLITGASPGSPMQAISIPPSDPRVAVMGRVDRSDPERVRMGYPGVTWRLRFEGAFLAMRVGCDTSHSHLAVLVDGGAPRVVRLERGDSEVMLAEGLAPGPHTVEVVNRTETWMGIVGVRGFLLAESGALLPPDPWPSRRMLFVGDSVTCGERIDRQPNETEPFASSNAYLSFGMLLARRFDAQVHLVCYGGRGLLRDWRGRRDVLTGPQLFEIALPDEVGPPAWDHALYTPDVVFVSLGSNDFNLAIGPLPEREEFVSAYGRFVRSIRARHPQAHVFLSDGAIVNDQADPTRPQKTVLREYLTETARLLDDAHVRLAFSRHHPGDPQNSHPTREQHAAMARDLEPVIRRSVGW